MERHKGFMGDAFDTKVEILENGVRYMVDVEDGQKTGFFLDQKYNRLAVQNLCRRIQPKQVLCLLYTSYFLLPSYLPLPHPIIAVFMDKSNALCAIIT